MQYIGDAAFWVAVGGVVIRAMLLIFAAWYERRHPDDPDTLPRLETLFRVLLRRRPAICHVGERQDLGPADG